MTKPLNILIFVFSLVLVPSIGFPNGADFPELERLFSESECPSYSMLNSATKRDLKAAEDHVFSSAAYEDIFQNLGIDREQLQGGITPLFRSNSHAACVKLNKWWETVLYDADYVRDRQHNRTVAIFFPMYYRVRDRFIALVSPYNQGSPDGSQNVSPAMGPTRVFVFNEDVEKIGEFQL